MVKSNDPVVSALAEGSCIKAFAKMHAHRILLDHYLVAHAPHVPDDKPVTLPRSMFDILCMAALAGLEAAEKEDEKANNSSKK